jgi:hypothetical protein
LYRDVTRLNPGAFLITVALATAPANLAAQSLVCRTIRPRENASSVAQRLTGRADSRIQPWFRIVDRSSRVIPKARYDGVLAGWYACVPTARLRRTRPVVGRPVAVRQVPVVVAEAPVAVAPTHAAAAALIAQRRPILAALRSRDPTVDLALLCFGAVMFGAAIGLGWQRVEQFLEEREAVTREMQGFGNVFVKDFERPLVLEGFTTSPIRARLRCLPGDRRLEILVAPAAGRRYPNLDDHRQNVEYDVERITQRLSHNAFVRHPLRAEGAWVVIPFHFNPSPRTGAVA